MKVDVNDRWFYVLMDVFPRYLSTEDYGRFVRADLDLYVVTMLRRQW